MRSIILVIALLAIVGHGIPVYSVEKNPSTDVGPTVLTLTLDDALRLFLKQNVDLLMAQYGIDSAKGLEVTTKLFPNPTLSLDLTGSSTLSFHDAGSLSVRVDQLFELAGKRGYRQQSAHFGVQSAEAAFTDALRTLGFAVKDAFYHVLRAQQKLELAKENSINFADVLRINEIRLKKGAIAEVDVIKLRVQLVDFQNQVVTATQDFLTAKNLLKGLLAVRRVDIVVAGELQYKPFDLSLEALLDDALASRPDLVMKTRAVGQKTADLKLARALRVPDITVGADTAIQGPQGPNSPHQYGFGLSVPLPLFNRNQGGILQAEADLKTAQADLEKTTLTVEIDVENAYRDYSQSELLVKAYQGGVLKDATEARDIARKAYERGGTSILDVLDAFRTFNVTMQGYIDALYAYQHGLLEMSAAVGKDLAR